MFSLKDYGVNLPQSCRSLNVPLHLKGVAALPCKILFWKNCTYRNLYSNGSKQLSI